MGGTNEGGILSRGRVIQQQPSLMTGYGAGGRGEGHATVDTRAQTGRGRSSTASLGLVQASLHRFDLEPSPPRVVGRSRGRSNSLGSTSTRPRVRSRHLSPSPPHAAEATELVGILRRRRRSESLDIDISGRPRQRPRVSFAPNTGDPSRAPRSLADIFRWIRSPVQDRVTAGSEQRGRSSPPTTSAGRGHSRIVTPAGARITVQTMIARTGRTIVQAPPLPQRARAGAGISRHRRATDSSVTPTPARQNRRGAFNATRTDETIQRGVESQRVHQQDQVRPTRARRWPRIGAVRAQAPRPSSPAILATTTGRALAATPSSLSRSITTTTNTREDHMEVEPTPQITYTHHPTTDSCGFSRGGLPTVRCPSSWHSGHGDIDRPKSTTDCTGEEHNFRCG